MLSFSSLSDSGPVGTNYSQIIQITFQKQNYMRKRQHWKMDIIEIPFRALGLSILWHGLTRHQNHRLCHCHNTRGRGLLWIFTVVTHACARFSTDKSILPACTIGPTTCSHGTMASNKLCNTTWCWVFVHHGGLNNCLCIISHFT